MDWERKWTVTFNTAKTQLALFDPSKSCYLTDVKMDVSVLDEK